MSTCRHRVAVKRRLRCVCTPMVCADAAFFVSSGLYGQGQVCTNQCVTHGLWSFSRRPNAPSVFPHRRSVLSCSRSCNFRFPCVGDTSAAAMWLVRLFMQAWRSSVQPTGQSRKHFDQRVNSSGFTGASSVFSIPRRRSGLAVPWKSLPPLISKSCAEACFRRNAVSMALYRE